MSLVRLFGLDTPKMNSHSYFRLGSNTTVTVKSHRGTIPSLPNLGEAFSVLSIDIPVPRISNPDLPDDGNDGKDRNPHFIQDATVLSPLFHATKFH
jgi:hypothetical protein